MTSRPTVRDYAFVVTKPLQLVFATSIIRQMGIAERSTLIITDDFNDALAVSERLKTLEWELSLIDTRFCADRRKAEQVATTHGAKVLFVDSDVGLKRFLLLSRTQMRRHRPQIWVYEEGIGTYRNDMYPNVAKRQFFKSLGIGTHFGGSRFTRGVYVREPKLFLERFQSIGKEVRYIENSPAETLGRDIKAWAYIFNYTSVEANQADTCTIYLTDWNVREEGLARLDASCGIRFVKPHPHIKTLPDVLGAKILSATAPAELVLMDLLEKYARVTVIHHGSSCERYVVNQRLSYVKP